MIRTPKPFAGIITSIPVIYYVGLYKLCHCDLGTFVITGEYEYSLDLIEHQASHLVDIH